MGAMRSRSLTDYCIVGVGFPQGLMAEWEAEVEERIKSDEHYLSTQEGRETLSTMRLTQDHIKPLFRLLKHRHLPTEIERALWLMTKAMQARNYREAGDIYVRVAIGNAPWPIGVTMVGIHERRRGIGGRLRARLAGAETGPVPVSARGLRLSVGGCCAACPVGGPVA